MYEIFEHTADLGLRIRSGDLETLFCEAGRALFATIVANQADIRPLTGVDVRLDHEEPPELLVDWLNELLYLFECRHLVLGTFAVQLSEAGLTGQVRGEQLDPLRHQLEHEVKAITYHGLKVEREADGWLAEVIVDI